MNRKHSGSFPSPLPVPMSCLRCLFSVFVPWLALFQSRFLPSPLPLFAQPLSSPLRPSPAVTHPSIVFLSGSLAPWSHFPSPVSCPRRWRPSGQDPCPSPAFPKPLLINGCVHRGQRLHTQNQASCAGPESHSPVPLGSTEEVADKCKGGQN